MTPEKKTIQKFHWADLVLLTSKREGGPLVTKEAVYCGTRVVCTAVGDTNEWLPSNSISKKEDYSFEIIRKGKVVSRRRFDHFFTSDDIKITKIEYLHSYRVEKLSDHSPIMIDFEL